MSIENKELKSRIIDVSYKHNLSHLGSNLTAVDIINDIYEARAPSQWKPGWDEKFVNDSGHSGLAQYVVLEKFGYCEAEEMFLKHGVHPNADIDNGLYVSTGSLGMGIGISLGLALANREKNVYCLTSDGASNEGVFWESLRVAHEQKLSNLKVYLNANGFGAYEAISTAKLEKRIQAFGFPVDIRWTNMIGYPEWLQGLGGHYVTMDQTKYEEMKELLK